jgi:TIR domain
VHHVFVSYSRTDAEWVTRLVERLERGGKATWLDQRDIPLTLPWFEEIGEAIVAADLFLICDSPASRESTACGAEARLAFDAAKQSVEVEVGSDVDRAAAKALRAMAELGTDYKLRTELAVLARDWDRGGRERGALAPSRTRRRLLRGAHVEPPLTTQERSFLRESRSRARRRTAVSVVVGLTIGLSALTSIVVNAAQDKTARDNDEQAAAYMQTHASLRKATDDPYGALSQAAAGGKSESAIDALVAAAGFEVKVPDDAFAVPASARRFATTEIGRAVIVADAGGDLWRRVTSARDVRSARPVTALPREGTADRLHSLRARAIPDSGTVEVLRDGVLWRRIEFSQHPAALQLSPDGRELAAGGGSFAEIADLRQGGIRTTVSGAVGPIRDLAWSEDGRRLWALGRKLVVSWPVRDGLVLVDEPAARFEALLPAASDSAAWVVADDGELRQIAIDDGRVLARMRVPDEIHAAAGAPDGAVAALSGERGVWIVPLSAEGEPRLFRVPNCSLGRASFVDAETYYLPCLSGPVLQMSVKRADPLRRIKIGPAGAFAVRAMPGRGTLMASDTFAHLFAVPPGGKARELFYSPCGGTISRIAIAANEQVVVPTGSGSGLASCVRRGRLVGDDPASASSWSFDSVNDPVESALAEAAAVSDGGGAFAFGYSDGTVVVHPTVNILPARQITNVVGEIRDMYVAPHDRLLIATAAGIVQRVSLCDRCLTNSAFAESARRLLARGVEIGTAIPEDSR